MNPYEELGVGVEADAAAIKAAHRKRAKETHPDHGGDEDDFQKVQTAYLVLSDPEKRAHYDRTGEVQGDKPSEPPRYMQMIVQTFHTIIEDAVKLGTHTNYIETMKSIFTKTIGEINDAIEEHKTELAVLNKVMKRFKTKREVENDIFQGVIAGKINAVTKRIERSYQALEDAKKALAYLDNFTFEVEERDPTAGLTEFQREMMRAMQQVRRSTTNPSGFY